jgi:hypothetical protein
VEGGDGGGQRAGDRERGRDRAKPQAAGEGTAHRGEVLAEPLGVGQEAVRPGHDTLTLRCQPAVGASAHDDRHAQFRFEGSNAPAQGGLGDMTCCSSAAEVAFTGERDDVFQLP